MTQAPGLFHFRLAQLLKRRAYGGYWANTVSWP